jgi:aspartate-semialdehyde dehydrogenase
VGDFTRCAFGNYDAAFFCVGGRAIGGVRSAALAAGAVVDKSNAYRLRAGIPLVVAGVNEQITAQSKLLANPNCTTIVLAHALGALQRRFGLRSVFAATYQSVSGAGREGVTWLVAELARSEVADSLKPGALSGESIAYNVQPRIGRLDAAGRAGEEVKLIEETRKILALPELPVVAHAVRVPVPVGHAIAVTVELDAPASAADLAKAWRETPT